MSGEIHQKLNRIEEITHQQNYGNETTFTSEADDTNKAVSKNSLKRKCLTIDERILIQ